MPEQTVNVLKQPGAKDAAGSATLNLEDFKLQPGDVVSVYATAKDAHAETKTDMSFIQVDPFEREFSQSQQSGGGGGGGGGGRQQSQTDIARREKELIEATFKQGNEKKTTAEQAAATGQAALGGAGEAEGAGAGAQRANAEPRSVAGERGVQLVRQGYGDRGGQHAACGGQAEGDAVGGCAAHRAEGAAGAAACGGDVPAD